MLPDRSKYNLNDLYVMKLDNIEAPWGLIYPDITFRASTRYKKPIWEYVYTEDLAQFVFDSLWETGYSWVKLDAEITKVTGVKCWSEHIIKHYPELHKKIMERHLEIHHNKVLNFQDYELSGRDKTPTNIKLADMMYRSRLGVLARLDKRHREKLEVESNISDGLAQIIIARKNKEADVDE